MSLADKDLKEIKKIVEVVLEYKLDENLEKRLSLLPSKEEFYSKMDEIVGELKAIREEQTVASSHISDHGDRITAIEKSPTINAN